MGKEDGGRRRQVKGRQIMREVGKWREESTKKEEEEEDRGREEEEIE